MKKEVLTPSNYFTRMAEIQAAGGRVFRQERGDRNSDWIISWYEAEAPSPPESTQSEIQFHQT